jgi:hypothetical protein
VYGLLGISLLFFLSGISSAATRPVGTRQYFPNFVFADTLSRDEQTYLEISARKNFSIKNIRSTVIIMEMFNTYCTICPRNVPVLNDLYSLIENDPKLRGKIKIISIAVGNTSAEITAYKKTHSIRYPILSDSNFALHRLLGDPRVPYTMLIKRNRIVHTHQGLLDSSESLLGPALKYRNRD